MEKSKPKDSQQDRLDQALKSPLDFTRAALKDDLLAFIEYFWPEVSQDAFQVNWHLEVLCDDLMDAALALIDGTREEGEGRKPKAAVDRIYNVPPGTTKTITVSIMFPAWCWTRWPWMRFIGASYSSGLSLEAAEYCRDLVKSERYRELYPHIRIKPGKDVKSNFRIVTEVDNVVTLGGGRYSTSVGGTLTGFHAHFLLIDDPLNPNQAVSPQQLANAIHWQDYTLPTRKVNKRLSTIILVMQRLHQGDNTGHMLEKAKRKAKGRMRHICLPGEINTPGYGELVSPPELAKRYVDGLLDPHRMDREVLADLEVDLGQYGYASQVGQNPVPPSGGMFDADRLVVVDSLEGSGLGSVVRVVRYWDKAGTEANKDIRHAGPAWTVGTKLALMSSGKYLVMDVVRGRWSAEKREQIIRQVAEADGRQVRIYVEQEPGSGGKESAEATIRNLAGFVAEADRPTGDKVYRADPWSVQVNNSNVCMLRGEWVDENKEEYRYFPFSKFKDQVDSASGAFAKLAKTKKRAGMLFRRGRG